MDKSTQNPNKIQTPGNNPKSPNKQGGVSTSKTDRQSGTGTGAGRDQGKGRDQGGNQGR